MSSDQTAWEIPATSKAGCFSKRFLTWTIMWFPYTTLFAWQLCSCVKRVIRFILSKRTLSRMWNLLILHMHPVWVILT